jgi:hypothetical protein
MALTKADYEKVLGKSITDVEFKSLTQSRNQDPFVGRKDAGESTPYDAKQVKADQKQFLAGEAGESSWEGSGQHWAGERWPRQPGEPKGAYDARVKASLAAPGPPVSAVAPAVGTSVVPAQNIYGTAPPVMVPIETGPEKTAYEPLKPGIGAAAMGKFHAAPTVGFVSPHNVEGGQGSVYASPKPTDWPPPPPPPSSLPVQKAGKMIDGSSPSSGSLVAGMSHAPAWQYEHQQGGAPIIGTVAGPVADGLLYAPPPSLAQGSFGIVNREGLTTPLVRVDETGAQWWPPMVLPPSDETAAKAAKKKAGG